MTDTAETTLPNFPLKRSHPEVIPPDYEVMRGEGIGRARLPTGQVVWIISSYRHARSVLADRRFSAEKTRPDFPRLSPRAPEKLKHFAPFLPNMEGAAHAQLRRDLNEDFSPAGVARIRPRLQQAVDETVEGILTSPTKPVDIVQNLSFATAYQLQEILLGIPTEELAKIRRNTEDLLMRSGSEAEERAAAARLHHHIDALLAAKEEQPGDDLVSRQIARHRQKYGKVDRYELASLVQLLAVGDYNSIAAMVSLGVLVLMRHPAVTELLVGEPARMTSAVSEILRFYSVNDATPIRVALEDVHLGDTLVRAGDGVAVPLVLANRDSGLCPHADELRLLRENSKVRHIAFGHGPHLCLGHLLAPIHLEICYRTLFERIPQLRLAVPEADLTYTYHSPQAFGPVELPVTW